MKGLFASPAWRHAAWFLVLSKLWLAGAQPIFAIGGTEHDDQLFLTLARHILNGAWLGPYDELTLAKGPAYPLFIALTVIVGLPLPLAQHVFYLGAVYLLVRALRPLLPGDGWAFVLFAVLVLSPMTYEMTVLGRVLRQGIYTSLALLVFAGVAGLHARADASPFAAARWAVVLGLGLGGMWLTREESVWIAPSLALLAMITFSARWRDRGSCLRLIQSYALAAAVAASPILTTATLNKLRYGWFGTVEFRAPDYIAAYSALNRVRPPQSIPNVPVARAARELIYAASPAFAELRPYLEGPVGRGWAGPSAIVTHRDPEEREIAGGWWMWALRQAVAESGHAYSARAALHFYARVAKEVNAACDTGRLPAEPTRHSLLPIWQPGYTTAARSQWLNYLDAFATLRGFSALTPQSMGNPSQLQFYRDITQWRHSYAPEALELDAPVSATYAKFRVSLLHRLGKALRWVNFTVMILGLGGWTAAIVRFVLRRSWPSYLWWYASAAWGAMLAILLINFLVHVTSFPAQNPGYFSHAYPVALLAAVISAAGAALAWRELQPGATSPLSISHRSRGGIGTGCAP